MAKQKRLRWHQPRTVRGALVLAFSRPKDTHFERHCGRKVQYPNRKAARRTLRRLATIWGADMGGLRAYRCYYCNQWHLGNKRGAPRRESH